MVLEKKFNIEKFKYYLNCHSDKTLPVRVKFKIPCVRCDPFAYFATYEDTKEFSRAVINYGGNYSVEANTYDSAAIIDNRIISVGDKVDYLIHEDNIKESVIICAIEEETKYHSAGGAYYGAGVRVSKVSLAGRMIDGSFIVSEESPLGKALIGKRKGEIFYFESNDGEVSVYEICDVTDASKQLEDVKHEVNI